MADDCNKTPQQFLGYVSAKVVSNTAPQRTDVLWFRPVGENVYNILYWNGSSWESLIGGSLTIQKDGSTIGSASVINFIEGDNVTITAVSPGLGQINITIASDGTGGGSVASVNGMTGTVVLSLEGLSDVPDYPDDGFAYYLSETDGVLTWELVEDSGTTWGAITGNLADQTDLQNALDLKANQSDLLLLSTALGDLEDRVDVIEGDIVDIEIEIADLQSEKVDAVIGTTDEIDIDATTPTEPIASLAQAVKDSLALADDAIQPGEDISLLNNDVGYIDEIPVYSIQQVITPAAGDLNYVVGTNQSFRSTIGSATELQYPTFSPALPTDGVITFYIKVTFSADADLTFAAGYFNGDTALPTISGLNTEVYLLYCTLEENGSFIDVNVVQKA